MIQLIYTMEQLILIITLRDKSVSYRILQQRKYSDDMSSNFVVADQIQGTVSKLINNYAIKLHTDI